MEVSSGEFKSSSNQTMDRAKNEYSSTLLKSTETERYHRCLRSHQFRCRICSIQAKGAEFINGGLQINNIQVAI